MEDDDDVEGREFGPSSAEGETGAGLEYAQVR